MNITINEEDNMITIELSIEELVKLINKETEPTEPGYGIEQYKADVKLGYKLVTVHHGFKIYVSNSSNYYTWWRDETYESGSNLLDSKEEAKLHIDDYVKRINYEK